jgi:PHP family Zn ribbon phosphoesterase
MTMQRRTTIEPYDIVSLEFECRQCHARYSVTLAGFSKAQMKCPNCGVQWLRGIDTPKTPDSQDVKIARFVQSVQDLQASGLEAIIRLEISMPPGGESGKIES